MLLDAMQFFHGSGTAAFGPITSTAKSFTGSIATTGVLTITAGTAGSELLVGDSLTGANISTVGGPTIVTAISGITAANGVGTYTVSNPQLSTSATILATPALLGDLLVVGTTSQQSNLEIDFGAPNPGTSNPLISAFPSLTEKGYSYPPEVVGDGGIPFGVHIVVSGPVYGNSLTSIAFNVESASTTNATNIIATRSLTIAQLQVAGAHYWIPVPGNSVLEFLRWNAVNTPANNGYVGSIYSWWGPKCGGEQ